MFNNSTYRQRNRILLKKLNFTSIQDWNIEIHDYFENFHDLIKLKNIRVYPFKRTGQLRNHSWCVVHEYRAPYTSTQVTPKVVLLACVEFTCDLYSFRCGFSADCRHSPTKKRIEIFNRVIYGFLKWKNSCKNIWNFNSHTCPSLCLD